MNMKCIEYIKITLLMFLCISDVHVQERQEPGFGVDRSVRGNVLSSRVSLQECHGRDTLIISYQIAVVTYGSL